MTIYTWQREFISAEEVCDYTGLDLATVYQKAWNGEIPGAIWDETLCFERDEFSKWWESELEKVLRELEEAGLIISSVDSDGQRRYCAKKFVH
jgi:excisionase family DNA binding protein